MRLLNIFFVSWTINEILHANLNKIHNEKIISIISSNLIYPDVSETANRGEASACIKCFPSKAFKRYPMIPIWTIENIIQDFTDLLSLLCGILKYLCRNMKSGVNNRNAEVPLIISPVMFSVWINAPILPIPLVKAETMHGISTGIGKKKRMFAVFINDSIPNIAQTDAVKIIIMAKIALSVFPEFASEITSNIFVTRDISTGTENNTDSTAVIERIKLFALPCKIRVQFPDSVKAINEVERIIYTSIDSRFVHSIPKIFVVMNNEQT